MWIIKIVHIPHEDSFGHRQEFENWIKELFHV